MLAALEKESQPIAKKVSSLEIESQEDYELAGKLIKSLKDKVKQAKIEEGKIVDPLKEALEAARKHFKPFYSSIDLIEIDTKNKMAKFLAAQQLAQSKLEQRVERGTMKLSTMVQKSEELSTKNAFSKVRRVKVLVIEKPQLVPREYCVPDEKKIKEALLSGQKIAGCKLVEENQIAI